ncbi:MAG: endonuclease MutS2 [Nitrospirae bacterium]|nr:endonuclease MutS2 [Nitrospirota bacterium]
MDEITFKALEYEKILNMVAAFSTTAEGREGVQSLRPLRDYNHLLERLSGVAECIRLLSEGRETGIEPMDPMTPLFEKLRPEDAVLEGMELRAFLSLFSSSEALKRLYMEIKTPVIKKLLSGLYTHPELRREIERSIERDGTIKDEASPHLYEIRRAIQRTDRRIKAILEHILDNPQLAPHIQDFYITERNGRRVIPVKHDSKGHIPGVIHDISNTGETVFVEPREAVQLGNELESLRAEEKLEEFRILKTLSSMIRAVLQEIESDHTIVIKMDILQSLARFAEHIGAELPEINKKGIIEIRNGRHPLLWRTLKKMGREDELVALDFTLGRQYTGLVITGPNAGGKTVVLKTVGVIVLMALSGIPVPAASGTSVPFLRSVLADIGDEQSIEANISTFSGHVLRMKEILEAASKDSLVIIDEMGTGTDPDEGGALGCSILKRLKEKKTLTVVSTHLGLIKAFAHGEDGLENGSMLMEQHEEDGILQFKPTYRLRIGIAGQSHALEIAKRLGMPEDIIEEARGLLGDKERYLEDILSSLSQKEMIIEREIEKVQSLRTELLHLRNLLMEEIKRIKIEKREIMKKAATKAEEFYRKAINEAEEMLRKIKQEDRTRARQYMRELIRNRESLRKKIVPEEPERKHPTNIEVGMTVHIGTIGKEGVIKSLNRTAKRCRVVVMGKELDIPFSDIYEPEIKAANEKKEPSTVINPEKMETIFPGEINLLGYRVDEALSELERYLNDASLSGVSEIRIIHGIGTGALSRAIREYLKEHPLVSNFRPGRKEEGGDGVTVVSL